MSIIRNTFRKYPFISNCVIYGGLYMTAEISQQTIYKKYLKKPEIPEPAYDFEIVKRYGIVATAGMGPTLFLWYKWLDKKLPGISPKTIVKKCLLDQFLMTPQILVIFYVGMAILERNEDLFGELKQKFVSTFKANCLFWMPIQALNFSIIPPQFRVIYIGTCSLFWANILVYFKRG